MKRIGVLTICCAALLAACSNGAAPGSDTGQGAVKAAVVPAKMTPVAEQVSLPGTVRGADTALLTARTGGRVTRLAVEAGDRVAANALLLEVDPADARAALADAQAKLTSARADWQQAEADEKRYAALLAQEAVTKREYEQVRHRLDAARAAREAARQGVAAARQRVGYAVVKAPFAGVVADRRVDAGDVVPPGAPLLTIAGGRPEVRVYAGEALFTQLTPSTPVSVSVGGKTLRADIAQLVAAADPATHTHLVKLTLAAGTSATIGAYATATFTTATAEALTIPASAVTTRAGLIGAFVVDDDGTAHFRELRLGRSADGRTVVAAGVGPGERVVAAPTPAIGNGTRIMAGNGDD